MEFLAGTMYGCKFVTDVEKTLFVQGAFCSDGLLPPILCELLIFFLCGFDFEEMDEELLETIVRHTPAGASSKQLFHYAWEVGSGE